MAMTAAQGRRWKRQLEQEIRRDLKRQARAKLVELRAAIRVASVERRQSLKAARDRCRADRRILREHLRDLRKRAREELRATIAREKREARETCAASLASARGIANRIERARAELLAERQYRAEMRRLERGNVARKREEKRASRAERARESDDEVRANIPPEYVELWERVKRGIRGSERQTRTEAFLQYAEEHPEELLAGLEERTEALIRDYEAQQRAARRGPRRAEVRERLEARFASGSDVPF